MKKKLLITAPFTFLPDLLDEIKLKFEVLYEYQPTKTVIQNLLDQFQPDAWIPKPCNEYLINEELLKLSKSLKIIATPSTGTNHIDIESAEKLEISIFSLKGSKTVDQIKASSEYTFALLLSTVRKIPLAYSQVTSGHWREVEDRLRSRELSELTLGIIGCGRIGGNLVRYSAPFGMRVNIYDPYIKKNFEDRVHVCSSLNELLKGSDIVAICVHLNSETKGMIGDNEINQLKDGSFLINTSRGEVIEENALINGLKNGKIKAAGVDVVCEEHLLHKKENALINYSKNHNNLIVTPHIAGLTIDSERKAQEAAYNACLDYFKLNSL